MIHKYYAHLQNQNNQTHQEQMKHLLQELAYDMFNIPTNISIYIDDNKVF